MNSFADKIQENKKQTASHTVIQKERNNTPPLPFTDNHPATVAQRQLQEIANNSEQIKQATQLQTMVNTNPTLPIQKKGEEEEELQMKSIHPTTQLAGIDEEKLLQGKLETAQRVEDEELLQGKFEPTQRMEEEELLQGKLETAQRAEDEELLQGKFEPAQRADKRNNTGLPNQLKADIENLSGMSMDHVKVHYNSDKPAQLQAHAYAQGSEIHVAPGQEKHLPHEAWHVVQQAQGRVRPTIQMKAGVPVNDDAGLEAEADVMGAKALSLLQGVESQGAENQDTPLQPVAQGRSSANAEAIQKFKVDKAPETKQIFSVSDDEGILTGMRTPNHDLYVDNPNKVARINQAAAASPLNFTTGDAATLFHKPYYPVRVKFTPYVHTGVGDVNMQDQYERVVAPQARAFREARQQEGEESIGLMGDINVGAINTPLKTAVANMELFKKLILANLSNAEGGLEDEHAIADATTLVTSVERLLYSSNITKVAIHEVANRIGVFFHDESPSGRFDYSVILRDTITELGAAVVELRDALPEDHPIDLMSFHLVNFQAAQIEAMEGANNVLLYRACDVTASTVLGNKITEGNAQNLKTYNAGSGAAFHYAAKILNSSADWVSLEGFAAGAREQGMIGITDDTTQYNIDNSWQYIMYGSKGDEGDDEISGEDKYFETYTDLRYRLKGIDTQNGHFDLSRRQQLTGKQITLAKILTIFPVPSGMASLNIFADTPQQKADALVLRLKARGILTDDMRIANPPQLSLEQLQGAETGLSEDLLVRLHSILKESIPIPKIQLGRSSDLANMIAWRSYMGRASGQEFSEDNIHNAVMNQQDQVATDGEDPRAVSTKGWTALATDIAAQ
jgi:hypothetical protein